MRRKRPGRDLAAAAFASVLLAFPAPSAPSPQAGRTLQIKGSDTMVNLGQAWAEAFNKLHPEVNIAVTGGGSGTGISALISGTCDIAESSRAVAEKEIAQGKAAGMRLQRGARRPRRDHRRRPSIESRRGPDHGRAPGDLPRERPELEAGRRSGRTGRPPVPRSATRGRTSSSRSTSCAGARARGRRNSPRARS